VEELLTKQNLNIMNKLTEKDKQFVFDIEKEVNFSITNPTNIKLYTEEDLRRAIQMAWEADSKDGTVDLNIVLDYGHNDDLRTKWTEDEIIQFIQQPKRPKYFECEYKPITPHKYTVDDHLEVELKTITNSQGQIEIIGEYIYE
jgi:hypothetical protein